MLDVVFIMLIFFIVTSSFIKESGVEVQRPQADTASTQDKGNILIAVTADGQVWIDKQVVDVRSVRSEEHTSELQSLMRISYAVFCLKKKKKKTSKQKLEKHTKKN